MLNKKFVESFDEVNNFSKAMKEPCDQAKKSLNFAPRDKVQLKMSREVYRVEF